MRHKEVSYFLNLNVTNTMKSFSGNMQILAFYYYRFIADWCSGVVVITTAQIQSPNFVSTFCADSDPANGVSKVCDGEKIQHWFLWE